MTLTKKALGNLVNKYKAVLNKFNLLNYFGSLAVATMLVLGCAGVVNADSGVNWGKKDGNDNWIRVSSRSPRGYRQLAGVLGSASDATSGNVVITFIKTATLPPTTA